jgi:hypothetical protein
VSLGLLDSIHQREFVSCRELQVTALEMRKPASKSEGWFQLLTARSMTSMRSARASSAESLWIIAQQPPDYFPLVAIGPREPGSVYQKRGPTGTSFGVGFSARLDCDR